MRKYIYEVNYRSKDSCYYSKHYFPTMTLARDFSEQFIELGFYAYIKKIPMEEVKQMLNTKYGKAAQATMKEVEDGGEE